MKKILIASTALATLGIAGGATAAEWNAGVNGYMQIGVGFDGDQDGVGILRDGEIHFNARMTADNGLTFRARVELEVQTNAGDQIDENWASVGGSFGTIKIGGDDSAKGAYNNGVIYAPGARIGYYDGFGLFRTTSQPGIAGNTDDVGIHYDSPSFMGFAFGATFRPEAGTDNNGDRSGSMVFDQDNPGDNFYAFGAAYDGNFGDFGFGISGGYADQDSNGANLDDQWHIAGNVSFSGFTIAGGYEDDGTDEWYIGARYSTGPWTIAGGYSNDDLPGQNTEVGAGWVSYALAPGVSATAGLEYEDSQTVDKEVAGLAYLQLNF